jgi:hypothetical protein
MEKRFNNFIKKLPHDIIKYILRFIIYNSDNICFNYSKFINNENYSFKYKYAYLNDVIILNSKEKYLSRINKKNNKHRYYLTEYYETFYCNGCGKKNCTSWYCRGGFDYIYYYKNKYVGNNIDKALLELYLDK